MEARTIRVIPATQNGRGASGAAPGLSRRRRVAAYARVSTDSEEQATSYEAQVDFYTKKIKANPEWEFVEVYADEGVSGTSTKGRDGFKRMIEDALAGRIDLILTKSISRFARNTVDTLTTVRDLKAKNVEVFFEKENIYTLDSKGELLITIMGSLAQEESRSLSANVTWGKRKRFADGKFSMPYKTFLGYRKGPDGKPEIIPEEAEIVREIYARFLAGATTSRIAATLNLAGVPTPGGRGKWTPTNILSILSNEKYKGDALLQKTFTLDFLTHKHKRNEGEVDSYYVSGSHAAIIDPDEWELTQMELARRKRLGRSYRGDEPLSGRLVCADCGSFFGPKVWHSTDRFRTVVWQCNSKFDNEVKCETPHVREEDVKSAFVRAYNSLAPLRKEVLADLDVIAGCIEDPDSFNEEIKKASEEAALIAAAARDLVSRNASVGMPRAEFEEEYARLDGKYKEAEEKLRGLEERRKLAATRRARAKAFAAAYRKSSEVITEFGRGLWCMMVEIVKVHRDGSLEFVFRNGQSVIERIKP